MAKHTQADRPIAVTTPLGPDALLLVSFRGYEAISQLFQFELELMAEVKTPVAFERLVGQSVTVNLAFAGNKRHFNGIINRFSQGRRDAEFTHFRASMVPKFWLWTKKIQSRIFQQLTVPEILKKVLDGLDVQYELKGTYHPRDYCVQYRESDFAFASRLMEEEGIFYFFKHAESQHRLVVSDATLLHPEVPGPTTLTYDDAQGGLVDEGRVTHWEKTQELRAGQYTLWDHCFELPGKNLEAQRKIMESVEAGTVNHRLQVGGNERLEIYDYPGGYAQRFDGVDPGGGDRVADVERILEDNERTVRIRMEQETVRGLEIQGKGTCAHFFPGHKFTLTRHCDANGTYLLTHVEHVAGSNDYRSDQPVPFDYRNSFTGIPVRVPYRPSLTMSKPILPGTQTATVVGPDGEEIFCDKYGRVKVQFHWDRQGKKDIGSSCWVRVGQVWAGKGWGAFFWPRIGQEVIVAFEEGDPDRPIIVGSVYNAANMPPFKLPAKRLIGGIKSCSVRGEPHREFNGIIFIDEPGNEHLAVHSQKHQVLTNEDSQHTHIGEFCMHVVGGLNLPGSGSGGGEEPLHKAAKEQKDETVKVKTVEGNVTDVIAKPGAKSSIVFGQHSESVIGFHWEDALGAQREFILDPIAFFGPPFLPPIPILGMTLLAGWLGKSEVIFAPEAIVHYGPKMEVHYGSEYEWEGDFHHGKLTVIATTLGLVSAIAPLVFGVAGGAWNDLKEMNKAWFVTNVMRQALIGIQMSLEGVVACTELAKAKVKEFDALKTRVIEMSNPLRDVFSWSPALTDVAKARVFDSVKLIKDAANVLVVQNKIEENKTPTVNKKFEGTYTLGAIDISLISSAPDHGERTGKPTSILIDARGSGKDGSLWVHGTGSAMMSCDSACIAIRKKDKQQILIECDETGEIDIHQSDPATNPRICFKPNEIALSLGPMKSLETSKISMKEKEITMTVGHPDFPMSKFKMSMEGIEMVVAQQNSIKLKKTGIEINGLMLDLKGMTKAALEAALLNVQATGPLKLQGAITMMT